MSARRTKVYRDTTNGKVFGVAAGIADYTGIDALWVRLALVFLTFAVSGITIPLYFVAAFLMDDQPDDLYADEREKDYWRGVRQNPKRTAREVKARMRDIDRRLASVERYYVDSNPTLSAEIERLR